MSQDIAIPSSPSIATRGDLYTCLYDFVQTYALPSLDPQNIYMANQNRFSLPEDLEDYAVIDVITSIRHGTAIEQIIPGEGDAPDKLLIGSLFEHLVQVDFYSQGDFAQQRAITIANVGMRVGPQFFNQYGCSLLYMNDPRDMTIISESNQYVSRWILELRATIPIYTLVDLPGFDSAVISRIENVDVHHKP